MQHLRSPKSTDDWLFSISQILHFVLNVVGSGDSLTLSPALVHLLSFTLAFGDVTDPHFRALAKEALVLLKHLPVRKLTLPSVTRMIVAASESPTGQTRFEALLFLQPFVARHFFLLEEPNMLSLQKAVLSRLDDPIQQVGMGPGFEPC